MLKTVRCSRSFSGVDSKTVGFQSASPSKLPGATPSATIRGWRWGIRASCWTVGVVLVARWLSGPSALTAAAAVPAFGRPRSGWSRPRTPPPGDRALSPAGPLRALPRAGSTPEPVSVDAPRSPAAAEVRRVSVDGGGVRWAGRGAAVAAVAGGAAAGGLVFVSRKEREEEEEADSDGGEAEFNDIMGVKEDGEPEREKQSLLQPDALRADDRGPRATTNDDDLVFTRSRTKQLLLQMDAAAESRATATESEPDQTISPLDAVQEVSEPTRPKRSEQPHKEVSADQREEELRVELMEPDKEGITVLGSTFGPKDASEASSEAETSEDGGEAAGSDCLPAAEVPSAAHEATETMEKTVTKEENVEPASGSEEAEPAGDYETAARDALENLQFCYRAAFFGVAADVFQLIAGGGDLLTRPWTLLDSANFVDSLSLLGFGVGVLRMWRILQESVETDADLGAESLLDVLRAMKGSWFYAACSLAAGSVSTVADLGPPGPASVAGLAIAGGAALAARSSAKAAGAEKEGDGGEDSVAPAPTLSSGLAGARSEGMAAVRNMDLCVGGFGLYGLAQFTALAASSDSLVEKAIAMTDVLEEGTIAGLLATLAERSRPVVVDLTAPDSRGDDAMYVALYEAKKGAYSSIGDTLFYASAFALLATLYSGISGAIWHD